MTKNNREDEALDALISSILNEFEITPEKALEDAIEYANKKVNLPPEYKKALKNLEDKIFEKDSSNPKTNPFETIPEQKYEDAYVAMHRGDSSEKIDKDVAEELEKRRKKIIEEEKKKRDKKNDK